MLTRHELDVSTGKRSVIEQFAYRNEEGEVIVLDAIDQAPEGYEPFNPLTEV